MEIDGAVFTRICKISPQTDGDGEIIEDYPAERYDNKEGLRLNAFGKRRFASSRYRTTTRR